MFFCKLKKKLLFKYKKIKEKLFFYVIEDLRLDVFVDLDKLD